MYGPVQGLTVSAGNSDRQLTCAEYDLQAEAALFGFVDVLEDKKSTKEARQSVGLRRRPRAGDLLRRLPVIAQPVLSFLQRERKLRTGDAGGYPCATCDDAKASVVRTFANFFQSISFGFGIAGDALFLRVAHGALLDEWASSYTRRVQRAPTYLRYCCRPRIACDRCWKMKSYDRSCLQARRTDWVVGDVE